MEPATARAAIATGSPEIETAACVEPDTAAVVCAVAALAATRPKVGRLAVADCTALVACVFADPELPAGPAAAPMRAVTARLAAGEALGLLCGVAPSAAAGAVELPGADVFAAALADTVAFAAAASAGLSLTAAVGWVPG